MKEDIDFDEFSYNIAKAHIVRELKENVLANAIGKALSSEN